VAWVLAVACRPRELVDPAWYEHTLDVNKVCADAVWHRNILADFAVYRMKAKTHTFKGRIYSEIPDDIVKHMDIRAGDTLEFEKRGEDFILARPQKAAAPVPAPGPKTASPKERRLSADDKKVLNKVRYTKHTERTLENINKKLDAAGEKKFDELLRAGVIFRYRKYNKELYGISREYFRQMEEAEKAKAKPTVPQDPQIAVLEREGFLVLANENEARMLNEKLKSFKKKVHGIRGFDKRYYIVTDDSFSEVSRRLMLLLGRDRALDELSKELKAKEGLCKAVIEILREEGTVIEKRRGVYAKV
jgi:bifunctional DNA-binding transcriptional regulator/antitoxin component of YhaV-PrlF toxin-antitoxin module